MMMVRQSKFLLDTYVKKKKKHTVMLAIHKTHNINIKIKLNFNYSILKDKYSNSC